MKGYWENLRSFEKRVVVGVAAILFAIFNLWFVLPHFSDLAKMRVRLTDAQKTLEVRQEAIKQIPFFEAQVAKLQREGLDVPAAEQALQFARTVTEEEMKSGVNPHVGGKIFTRTNEFFLEQTTTVNVDATEQQLVDFLLNLGTGNSLIRVRDLGLSPDAPHQKLNANIKLVASYQKNPTKGSAPAGKRVPTKLAGEPSPAGQPMTPALSRSPNQSPQPGKKTAK